MDIWAVDGRFAVGMTCGDFTYEWVDGMLKLTRGDGDYNFASVTTNWGDFIEAIDENGAVLLEGGDGKWFTVVVPETPIFLRFKKLPDLELTHAEIDAVREDRRRYLVSDMPSTLGIPDKLTDAIAWLQSKLEEIPASCRESAEVSFGTNMEYGETYPNCEITYTEPESDEEVTRRIQVDRERERIAETAEREKLEQLKQKYTAA